VANMVETKPAIIGGFVLSGLVLGVAAILLFGHVRLFDTTQQAVVLFPGSVAGLTVGAPVTFRGVQVGSVQRISVLLDVKDLHASIPVYLNLNSDSVAMINGKLPAGEVGLSRLLNAGLKAELNQSSFVTGQLQVDLDLRPDIRTPPSGVDLRMPEIPAIPSQGLQLRQMEETAQRTLVSIQRISDEVGGKIGPLIDNVQKTSDAARETFQTTTEAVRKTQVDTAKVLRDVDRLAVDGQQQLNARGSELSRVLIETEHTAHEAGLVTTSLNDMTSPRSQTRENLEAAIRDLAATASSLRNFTNEVERNPSAILSGKAGQ
jgi:paraquat-inducible protein B